jgi:hypothetical protein
VNQPIGGRQVPFPNLTPAHGANIEGDPGNLRQPAKELELPVGGLADYVATAFPFASNGSMRSCSPTKGYVGSGILFRFSVS